MVNKLPRTVVHLSEDAARFLNKVLALLQERHVEGYLVGGFVRDAILGRPTRDVDVIVRGPIEDLSRSIARTLNGNLAVLGKIHPVHRVVVQNRETDQTPWQLDLTPLVGSIPTNMAERDFTIDALAIPLNELASESESSVVIDPFGGVEDIERKTLKATGPEVFRRDPGRLLRALRLAAQLGFSIEEGTQNLLRRDAPLLSQVAPERITTDLCGILSVRNGFRWLQMAEEMGLLSILLPELNEARGVEQPKEHYWDVFQHSMRTVEALDGLLHPGAAGGDECIARVEWAEDYQRHFDQESTGPHSRRALVKLSGLLHDVAKPATKTTEPSGRIRFFGHQKVGAVIAQRIMRRLRFSKREASLVESIVLHHLRPGIMAPQGEQPTSKAIHRFFREAGEAAIDTVFVNLADYRAARGPLLEWDEWREYVEHCAHILETGLSTAEGEAKRLLVNGHQLMEELGLVPGPLIGKLLEEVGEAQAAGEISTKEAALELARCKMKEYS